MIKRVGQPLELKVMYSDPILVGHPLNVRETIPLV